ncbi:SusC/RagA family TonB-linked outer membrane protein [Emticicia sp. CRIBPO]|uniref:SusC/RagA family TonB-linked outer membrane protein n=1 Tax=Emticicia sp. CRIBPO TaxID=2683258 RepID=UPI001412F855|nr:TonB-dependent receptor [Emticicia sp. CRIBPO]NBA86972.1 SusC/RagA family TonB-linked outer membrane protein [Emticicia sp. CRIBPO]
MMKARLLLVAISFLLCLDSWAQVKSITGKVTSSVDGSPLPGVSVSVKGTSRGTTTDVNGSYKFDGVESKNTLVFSFIGFVTKELAVGSQTVINLQLDESAQELAEAIVIGYGTTSPIKKTGSISTVKGEEIENTPFTSVDKALQGRIAGLQSTGGSGQPGSVQNIRIRGIGSMTAGSDPLYVVDGVPINSGDLTRNTTTANALAGLNPNDIESISVLKDAASSSIYGSRAANGVILITTKKGKSGKTQFRFDTEVGASSVGYLSDANRPLNTAEWRELTAEGLVNSKQAADLTAALALVDQNFRTNTGVDTDWLKEVTRTGSQQQYNLSASGGNEKTQFYLSGGYFKQQGTVLESQFDRYTGNVNLSNKATDKLTFKTNLMISATGQKGPGTGGLFANPVLATYFLLPSYAVKNADGTPNITGPDFPAGGLYNPVAIAKMDKRKTTGLKGLATVAAEYQLLKDLKLSTKVGIDYNNYEEDVYNNPFYGDGRNDAGRSSRLYTRYFNWVWTNLAEYVWDVKDDDDYVLNVTAGYEAQKSMQFFQNSVAYGLPGNLNITVPSAGSVYNSAIGSNSDYTFASALAIANFSVKNKYIASGSFRRDGSSRFGINNRFGNFWSVGGAWNIDKEEFLKELTWLNALKLRASYGVNGNAAIGNYDWQPTYAYGAAYNYLGSTGSGPDAVGNINLTWETNKPFDIGVDASLFNKRLNVTLEWYKRLTTNLLLNEPLSRTSGFTSFKNNVGSLENKGVEVTLTGTPLEIGDFTWEASFNISLNKNKILSLVNDADQVDGAFIRRVGKDYQSFWVREWAGVNPQTGAPQWYVEGSNGEITETYNSAKQVIHGSATPKAFGSFGSTFSFKGLSLDFLFYYNFGNMVRDAWANYTQSDGYNSTFNRVASQLARWQKPGDITNVPKYVYGGASASNSFSSRYLYEGDFIRLRDISLGYTIPSKWVSKAKLSNVKLYVRGSNIWTWVKDKNLPYDPETAINSSTNLDIYIPKTVTGGLQIGF